MQGVKGWLALHEKQVGGVRRIGFFEPLQGLSFLPQGSVLPSVPKDERFIVVSRERESLSLESSYGVSCFCPDIPK